MTRACPACAKGSGHKDVKYSSNVPHGTLSGGVAKSQKLDSPRRSLKTFAKAQSTTQCLRILKSLLPNARKQKKSSELELVKETIAYIAHLESVLHPPPAPPAAADMQPSEVASATAMLEEMSV